MRAELGDAIFAAVWTTGQAMTLEQAIAYALEEAGKRTGHEDLGHGRLRRSRS